MDLLQALGTLMSFTAFGLVGAGVMKAFHISNDLGEMKELLRDIRRSLEANSPRAAAIATEAVLRGLDEDDYARAVQARVHGSAGPLVDAVNAESALEGEVLDPQR